MGIPENDEKEQIEREVRLWCRIKKFPYGLYHKLNPANKTTFYKLTCQPTSMTTTRQRDDLFDDLFSPGSYVAGRSASELQELVLAEKKEHLFSPLTSQEKLDYFSKF